MSCTRIPAASSAAVSTQARAELVVPRSIPTTKRNGAAMGPSGHFDFSGSNDAESGCREGGKGQAAGFPAAVAQDATPRGAGAAADDLDPGRVDRRLERDRPALFIVDHRAQRHI